MAKEMRKGNDMIISSSGRDEDSDSDTTISEEDDHDIDVAETSSLLPAPSQGNANYVPRYRCGTEPEPLNLKPKPLPCNYNDLHQRRRLSEPERPEVKPKAESKPPPEKPKEKPKLPPRNPNQQKRLSEPERPKEEPKPKSETPKAPRSEGDDHFIDLTETSPLLPAPSQENVNNVLRHRCRAEPERPKEKPKAPKRPKEKPKEPEKQKKPESLKPVPKPPVSPPLPPPRPPLPPPFYERPVYSSFPYDEPKPTPFAYMDMDPNFPTDALNWLSSFLDIDPHWYTGPRALSDSETVQSNADDSRHLTVVEVDMGWVFAITNLLLKILLVILVQLASTQNPNYSLPVLVVATISVAFTLFELYFKATRSQGGVTFKRKGLSFRSKDDDIDTYTHTVEGDIRDNPPPSSPTRNITALRQRKRLGLIEPEDDLVSSSHSLRKRKENKEENKDQNYYEKKEKKKDQKKYDKKEPKKDEPKKDELKEEPKIYMLSKYYGSLPRRSSSWPYLDYLPPPESSIWPSTTSFQSELPLNDPEAAQSSADQRRHFREAVRDNPPPSSPTRNITALRQRKRVGLIEPEDDLVSSSHYLRKRKENKEENKDQKKYYEEKDQKKDEKKEPKKDELEDEKDEEYKLPMMMYAGPPRRSSSWPSTSSSQSELPLIDPEAAQSSADQRRHSREAVTRLSLSSSTPATMAQEKNEVDTNLDELTPLINNKDDVESDVHDIDAASDNNPPLRRSFNVLRQRKRLRWSKLDVLVSSGQQSASLQKRKGKIEEEEVLELVKAYKAYNPYLAYMPYGSSSWPPPGSRHSASSSFQFELSPQETTQNDPEAVQSNANQRRHYREAVDMDWVSAIAKLVLELEWVFIITNLVLEISLVVLDQLASPKKPYYSLTALVVSIIAIDVSLFELYLKARMQGVTFKREGLRFRFVCPSSHLYSFTDVFGFICALCQFIFSAIAYSFHRRHADNPINISIVSLVFIVCLAVSKLTSHCNKTPISACRVGLAV